MQSQKPSHPHLYFPHCSLHCQKPGGRTPRQLLCKVQTAATHPGCLPEHQACGRLTQCSLQAGSSRVCTCTSRQQQQQQQPAITQHAFQANRIRSLAASVPRPGRQHVTGGPACAGRPRCWRRCWPTAADWRRAGRGPGRAAAAKGQEAQGASRGPVCAGWWHPRRRQQRRRQHVCGRCWASLLASRKQRQQLQEHP